MADPNFGEVVYLGGFEDATPTDESSLAQAVTVYGAVTAVSAAQSKFGSQSLAIGSGLSDGTTQAGVSVPSHAAMVIGTQPFTIETFAFFTANFPSLSYSRELVCQSDGMNTDFGWELNAKQGPSGPGYARIAFYGYVDADASGDYLELSSSEVAIANNTWAHYACDFDGTTFRLYINGTMVGSTTTSGLGNPLPISFRLPSCPMGIGTGVYGTGTTYYPALDTHLDETRVTIGTARYASDAGFTVPAAAFDRTGPAPIYEEAIESLTTTDTVESLRWYIRAITDAFYASESTAVARPVAVAEGLTLTPVPGVIRGTILLEALDLLGELSASGTYSRGVAEDFALSAAARIALLATVRETATITDNTSAAAALQVMESVGITAAIIANSIRNLSLAEAVSLASSLAQFFSGELVESLALSETMTSQGRLVSTLAEAVTASDALASRFLLRADLAEGIDISAADALNSVYQQSAVEGVVFTGAIMLPGSFTTWTANTRTGAVTEYDNFEFNSFAVNGFKYVGATSEGLYEINGDTDAGEDIIASLKSGFMQFGGTRLSRLKAAYIAARGGGDFVLKIITGDDVTYTYGVTASDMRSTKVHMGKGQRARYFAFELTSAGQDFDLDTLEFVPIVVQRRV